MNFLTNYTEALGWALLHFLWQGTVIAFLLGVALHSLRKRSAHLRYALSGLALLLMLGAFLGTLAVVWERPVPAVVPVNRTYETYPTYEPYLEPVAQPTVIPAVEPLLIPQSLTAAASPAAASPAAASPAAASPPPPPVPFSEKVRPYLPWAVGIWAVGVVCFALRFLCALLAVRGWKRSGQDVVSDEWKQRFCKLCAALEVSRPAKLLSSAAIAVPMVIGWFKPVVLVPAGLFVSLTAGQLEAILAHELAHIRRHDYLINLFQHVMETLFFYHPAVWWISTKMRQEREHCCDDLAANCCGGALGYAKALTALEELRGVVPAMSISASGGSLLARIRRIMGLPEEKSRSWPLGILAVLALIIIPFAIATEERGTGLQPVGHEPATTATTQRDPSEPKVDGLQAHPTAKEEGRPAPLETEKTNKGGETPPLLERGTGLQPVSPTEAPTAATPDPTNTSATPAIPESSARQQEVKKYDLGFQRMEIEARIENIKRRQQTLERLQNNDRSLPNLERIAQLQQQLEKLQKEAGQLGTEVAALPIAPESPKEEGRPAPHENENKATKESETPPFLGDLRQQVRAAYLEAYQKIPNGPFWKPGGADRSVAPPLEIAKAAFADSQRSNPTLSPDKISARLKLMDRDIEAFKLWDWPGGIKVTILEDALDLHDLLAMKAKWQEKLQTVFQKGDAQIIQEMLQRFRQFIVQAIEEAEETKGIPADDLLRIERDGTMYLYNDAKADAPRRTIAIDGLHQGLDAIVSDTRILRIHLQRGTSDEVLIPIYDQFRKLFPHPSLQYFSPVEFRAVSPKDTPTSETWRAPAPTGKDAWLQLERAPILTQADVKSAVPQRNDTDKNSWSILLELTPTGAEKMTAFSKTHLHEALAIVADGVVLAAPTIQSEMGASVMITGNFTEAAAQKIVIEITKPKEEGRPAPLETEKTTKGGETPPLLERGTGLQPVSPEVSTASPTADPSAPQPNPSLNDARRTLVGSADGAMDQSWVVTNGPGKIKLNSSVTLLLHQEKAAAELPDNLATIRWHDEAGTEVGKRDVVLPRGKQFPPIIYQKGGDAFWFEEAILGSWQNVGGGELGVRKVSVVNKTDELKFWLGSFSNILWRERPFDGLAGAGLSYLMRSRNAHPAKALHLHFEDAEKYSRLQKSDVISITTLPMQDQTSVVEVTLSDTGMARMKVFRSGSLKAEWNNLKNYRLNVTDLPKFRIEASLTATEAEVLAAWLQWHMNLSEPTREGFPEVRFKAAASDRRFAGASDLEIREAGSYWVDTHLKAIVTSVAADGTIRNELEYRSLAPDGSVRTGKCALPDGEGTWAVLLRPHVKGIPWLSAVLTEAGMNSRAYFEDRGFDDDYVFPHISAEQLRSGEAKFPDAPQVITWATSALKQLKAKVGTRTLRIRIGEDQNSTAQQRESAIRKFELTSQLKLVQGKIDQTKQRQQNLERLQRNDPSLPNTQRLAQLQDQIDEMLAQARKLETEAAAIKLEFPAETLAEYDAFEQANAESRGDIASADKNAQPHVDAPSPAEANIGADPFAAPTEASKSSKVQPNPNSNISPDPPSTKADGLQAHATRLPGTWTLVGGVVLHIYGEVFHGSDVNTTAILSWPAAGNRPAQHWFTGIASDAFAARSLYAVAWDAEHSVLWIASRDISSNAQNAAGKPIANRFKRVDFSNPNLITETYSNGWPKEHPPSAEVMAQMSSLMEVPQDPHPEASTLYSWSTTGNPERINLTNVQNLSVVQGKDGKLTVSLQSEKKSASMDELSQTIKTLALDWEMKRAATIGDLQPTQRVTISTSASKNSEALQKIIQGCTKASFGALTSGTGLQPVSPDASGTKQTPDSTKGEPTPATNISPDPASAKADGRDAHATASLAEAQYLEASALAADGEKLLEAKDNTAAYYKFKDAAKLLDTLNKNHPNMRTAELISTREKLKQLTEDALRGEMVKRRPMMKIRGVNLADFPGQTDASKFPEVLEPYPGKPEIFRERKDVFSVVLGDRGPSIYYKAGSDHFYFKVWNYPHSDLYYGPIPGHPSRLGLAAWMREPAQVKRPDKMLYVASEMMKSGDETLAEIALGWLGEVQKGTPRSYERAVDEVKTWLAAHPDSKIAATCRETLAKLTSTADRVAAEWDKARPILPDDRYQAGELVAAEIPKVAWGKANPVGLSLGVTRLDPMPSYKFGEDIKLASIYLRNEGQKPISFSYSLAPRNNFHAQIHGPIEEISSTGIIMDPAKEQHCRLEPGRAIILSASYQLTILAESEREKKKAFIPARASTPSKPLPTNPIYVYGAGDYKLRLICNLSGYDVLDESGHMHPTPAGEWTGRLAADDIPIKIIEQDAGSSAPLEGGAGLQPASPEASSTGSAPEPIKGQPIQHADIPSGTASTKASGLQARATPPNPNDPNIFAPAAKHVSVEPMAGQKKAADELMRNLIGVPETKGSGISLKLKLKAAYGGSYSMQDGNADAKGGVGVPLVGLGAFPPQPVSDVGKFQRTPIPGVPAEAASFGADGLQAHPTADFAKDISMWSPSVKPQTSDWVTKEIDWQRVGAKPPSAERLNAVPSVSNNGWVFVEDPTDPHRKILAGYGAPNSSDPGSKSVNSMAPMKPNPKEEGRPAPLVNEKPNNGGGTPPLLERGTGLQPVSPDAPPTEAAPEPTKSQPTPSASISPDPASAKADGLQARATLVPFTPTPPDPLNLRIAENLSLLSPRDQPKASGWLLEEGKGSLMEMTQDAPRGLQWLETQAPKRLRNLGGGLHLFEKRPWPFRRELTDADEFIANASSLLPIPNGPPSSDPRIQQVNKANKLIEELMGVPNPGPSAKVPSIRPPGKIGYAGDVSAPRADSFAPPSDPFKLAEARERGIQITVTDTTGKPLRDFRVIAGVPSSVSDEFEKAHNVKVANWQSHTLHVGHRAGLIWPLDKVYDTMALRIEVDGYVPQMVAGLDKKKGPQELSFKLEEDKGVPGSVMLPDGKTAAKSADVVLAMIRRNFRYVGKETPSDLGNLAEGESTLREAWDRPRNVNADAGGKFTLPTEIDPTAVVIIYHQDGVLEIPYAKWREHPNVTLQPWGRIHGHVQWGDKVGAGETVDLSVNHGDAYGYPDIISQSDSTTTDAEGNFTFERVLPGMAQLSIPFKTKDAKGAEFTTYQDGMTIHADVKAPQTEVSMGGVGRQVKGQLTGRDNWNGVTFHFHPTAPHIGFPGDETMWQAWHDFQKSPKGPVFFRNGLKVNVDGSFAIPGMLPGRYQIFFSKEGEKSHVATSQFTVEAEKPNVKPDTQHLPEIKASKEEGRPAPLEKENNKTTNGGETPRLLERGTGLQPVSPGASPAEPTPDPTKDQPAQKTNASPDPASVKAGVLQARATTDAVWDQPIGKPGTYLLKPGLQIIVKQERSPMSIVRNSAVIQWLDVSGDVQHEHPLVFAPGSYGNPMMFDGKSTLWIEQSRPFSGGYVSMRALNLADSAHIIDEHRVPYWGDPRYDIIADQSLLMWSMRCRLCHSVDVFSLRANDGAGLEKNRLCWQTHFQRSSSRPHKNGIGNSIVLESNALGSRILEEEMKVHPKRSFVFQLSGDKLASKVEIRGTEVVLEGPFDDADTKDVLSHLNQYFGAAEDKRGTGVQPVSPDASPAEPIPDSTKGQPTANPKVSIVPASGRVNGRDAHATRASVPTESARNPKREIHWRETRKDGSVSSMKISDDGAIAAIAYQPDSKGVVNRQIKPAAMDELVQWMKSVREIPSSEQIWNDMQGPSFPFFQADSEISLTETRNPRKDKWLGADGQLLAISEKQKTAIIRISSQFWMPALPSENSSYEQIKARLLELVK